MYVACRWRKNNKYNFIKYKLKLVQDAFSSRRMRSLSAPISSRADLLEFGCINQSPRLQRHVYGGGGLWGQIPTLKRNILHII